MASNKGSEEGKTPFANSMRWVLGGSGLGLLLWEAYVLNPDKLQDVLQGMLSVVGIIILLPFLSAVFGSGPGGAGKDRGSPSADCGGPFGWCDMDNLIKEFRYDG